MIEGGHQTETEWWKLFISAFRGLHFEIGLGEAMYP